MLHLSSWMTTLPIMLIGMAGIILVMLFIGVAAWTSLGITDFMQKSGIGVVWRTATLLFY